MQEVFWSLQKLSSCFSSVSPWNVVLHTDFYAKFCCSICSSVSVFHCTIPFPFSCDKWRACTHPPLLDIALLCWPITSRRDREVSQQCASCVHLNKFIHVTFTIFYNKLMIIFQIIERKRINLHDKFPVFIKRKAAAMNSLERDICDCTPWREFRFHKSINWHKIFTR